MSADGPNAEWMRQRELDIPYQDAARLLQAAAFWIYPGRRPTNIEVGRAWELVHRAEDIKLRADLDAEFKPGV